MRGAIYDEFGGLIEVRDLPPPEATPGSAVIRVAATGICRSDWHGWRGHDPDIALPHVPGHELAGFVESVGPGVEKWSGGERVTVPFVAGCGECAVCHRGDPQVCARQSQPGFTHWGSFAELVRIDFADHNLVALPDEIDLVSAASLGCRTTTAYRAVAHHGRLEPDQWLAVHGCGGVGLAAVQIGAALGGRVVAVDVREAALRRAEELGATLLINASEQTDVAAVIRDGTDGGADVSIDAVGTAATCAASIEGLRRRGRHVQVGLFSEASTSIPMSRVIAWELELYGSHGMQADRFGELFALVGEDGVDPAALVAGTCSLEAGARLLMAMDEYGDEAGITVITFDE